MSRKVIEKTRTAGGFVFLILTGGLGSVGTRTEEYMREFSPTDFDTHVYSRHEKADGQYEFVVKRKELPFPFEMEELSGCCMDCGKAIGEGCNTEFDVIEGRICDDCYDFNCDSCFEFHACNLGEVEKAD